MAFLWCLLALLTFLSLGASGINPGVKVKATQKGLDYGRQILIPALQEKLKSIKIPDQSGTANLDFGSVSYSVTGIQIVNLGLPKSAVNLVPGTGVRLSISDAYINVRGNWRISYSSFITGSGSLDLAISGLSTSVTIAVQNDGTGRPLVSSANCAAAIGQVSVTFHGDLSWLYNLFNSYINSALHSELEKRICPLVVEGLNNMNPRLKTLNVLAQVDKYAEIDYSMVDSPVVSVSALDLSLKGEFYNIGQHKEPPFSPAPFSLPALDSKMLYVGLSAFTVNSAGFVYNNAGQLSLNITDDIIPSSAPFRLDTATLGAFIPQIAKQYPGLKAKIIVKAAKDPQVLFEPNKATVLAAGTTTVYVILPNGSLSPLFILDVNASVSARIYINGLKVAGALSLNSLDMVLKLSNVGPIEVKSFNSPLITLLNLVVMPKINAHLQQGFPIPAIEKLNLVNAELQILKDFILIGTDVQYTG